MRWIVGLGLLALAGCGSSLPKLTTEEADAELLRRCPYYFPVTKDDRPRTVEDMETYSKCISSSAENRALFGIAMSGGHLGIDGLYDAQLRGDITYGRTRFYKTYR